MYLALKIASYLTSDNDETYFLKRKTAGHVVRIEGMRFLLTAKSAENSKRTSLILPQKRLLEDILCIKLKLSNSILYCNIL